ncbi:MAG TPA: hypothetical protein VM370_10165 [Candidatus Thermoplasmatota archaeon]|nr:hypothetical protein [Candidatus Thermoplasmatota archaeon]
MERGDASWGITALLAFTGLSSFLGLSGRFVFTDPAGAFAFLGGIWTQSVVADLVFVAGSALAAMLAYVVARRTNVGFGAAASIVANWLVYLVSFFFLPSGVDGFAGDLGGTALFVGGWGIVGLLFCAVAAPAAAYWRARGSRAPRGARASMRALLLVALALALAGCAKPDAEPTARASVEMKDLAFAPASLEVAPGTRVTWTNSDTVAHTVTPFDASTWGSPGSGVDEEDWIEQGESWAFTFQRRASIATRASPMRT